MLAPRGGARQRRFASCAPRCAPPAAPARCAHAANSHAPLPFPAVVA